MSSATVRESQVSKEWLGHPRGLFILFLTEMWERFSFYGMRALLVLYMTKYLITAADGGMQVVGWETIRPFVVGVLEKSGIAGESLNTQAIASQIYGIHTSLVYITPILGGLLADNWLGKRKSVYLGGTLMAIGHFLMAIESFFFIALFFIVLGNGCFKPNISTQVGAVYPEGDKRVDGAYTIFYMGINLGAFFAALVCGTLGQKFGWHYGFGAAGVGMMFGLLVYHFGRGYLPP
ncbi:MAG: MFS transporter, partial [Proteobacteria bacterium]